MTTSNQGADTPIAWVRISNISHTPSGVFLAEAGGKCPDVELRTERMEPLFSLPPISAERARNAPVTHVQIPTKTMEQEFQAHYQRGFNAAIESVTASLKGIGFSNVDEFMKRFTNSRG